MFDNINPHKPIAFFDIDGVLVKPFVIRHFPGYLIQQIPPAFDNDALKQMDDDFYQHKNGILSYEEFAIKWVDTYAYGLAGQKVIRIAQLADEFWSRNWDLLYSYAEDVIRAVRPHCTTIAVSGSTVDSLQPLCDRLGIDFLIGSKVQTNPRHQYIATDAFNCAIDKAKEYVVTTCRRLVDNAVWEKSFGFGDNAEHDFPLLQYVGSPYLLADFSSPEKSPKAREAFALLRSKLPAVQMLRQPHDDNLIGDLIRSRLDTIGLC